MIFKASTNFKINSKDDENKTYELLLDNEFASQVGDVVGLVKSGKYNEIIVGEITEIDENNKLLIIIKSESELDEEYNLIVHYASKAKTEVENDYAYSNNLMIGVNSQNDDLGFLNKNSIVFKTYGSLVDKDKIIEGWGKPIILLGDLSSLKQSEDDKYEGYGLYAENVYLTGELSTGNSQNGYAGINTLHNISPNNNNFLEKMGDSSSIVFWAGTSPNDINNIASSSFFVTKKGSLYANKGYFEDSLYVNSTIEAATIKTAAIHGKDSTLKIYDTAKGI